MRIRTRAALLILCSLSLIGPAAALDQDGDGLDDSEDNCREHFNRRQLDADGDGFGNRCDVDFNQDGIANGRDVRLFTRALRRHDPVADINEDGKVNRRDAVMAVGLWGSPPGPGADPADDDGDGVPLAQDACPDSMVGGTPLSRGCGAVDLTLSASRLITGPVVENLLGFPSKFSAPEFAAFGNDVEIDTLVLDSAGSIAEKGDPCLAAAWADRAVDGLMDLRQDLPFYVEAHEGRVASTIPPPGGTPGVDWMDSDEFVNALLPVWMAQREFDKAVESAAGALLELEEVCAQISGPLAVEGEVAEADPGTGRFQLTSGEVLALADQYEFRPDARGQVGAILPGVQVSVQGSRFLDGTAIVTLLEPLTVLPPATVQGLICLKLKVIPFQLDPWFTKQPFITHNALAYRPDGSTALRLEEGTILTVDDSSCPPPTNPLHRAIYRARIELTSPSGGTLINRNLSLKPGELFYLPSNIKDFANFKVQWTTLRTECNSLPPLSCTAPDPGITQSYPIVMTPRFTYCTVDYLETEFPLETAPPGAFAPTQVVDTRFNLGVSGGSSKKEFSAIGIPVINGVVGSSVGTILEDEPFAIYDGDFSDASRAQGSDQEQIEERFGTASRSGLLWPRLIGHRNGDDFWYSCNLPDLARDVLDYCPAPLPHAYFTLPFDNTGVGQGPNGSFSHQGSEAWDLPADIGTSIYAARRGTVTFVREDSTENCTTSPSDCVGNGVVIRHDDGTTATYWHVDTFGANVSEDDIVARGQFIALSGNTGFSTGPHLHFQSDNAVDILFRTWKLVDPLTARIEKRTCYEPATGDILFREP